MLRRSFSADRLPEVARVLVSRGIEFLLGKYCASTDEEAIREGLEFVRETLSSKYVKPDEWEAVVKPSIKRSNSTRHMRSSTRSQFALSRLSLCDRGDLWLRDSGERLRDLIPTG